MLRFLVYWVREHVKKTAILADTPAKALQPPPPRAVFLCKFKIYIKYTCFWNKKEKPKIDDDVV